MKDVTGALERLGLGEGGGGGGEQEQQPQDRRGGKRGVGRRGRGDEDAGAEAGAEDAETHAMPADENFVRCPVTKEGFETPWDDRQGEFVYKNAAKVRRKKERKRSGACACACACACGREREREGEGERGRDSILRCYFYLLFSINFAHFSYLCSPP